MMNALYSAATGMEAMQQGMDMIAQNLANVNTTGFKSSRLTFEDLLYQQIGDRQASRLGAQIGMGVAPGRTQLQFSQGDLQPSDVPTNMAMEGNGFFQVVLPSGELGYTRDGNFTPDANGQLVNSSGFRLEPSVVIPTEVNSDSVTIGTTGRVTGQLNGNNIILGQIDVASFVNPEGLYALGNNTYAATVNSGPATVGTPGDPGLGVIRQGFLEGSNVKTMDEMVNMITAQRAFESVAKVLSTSDEMLGIANSIRR